MNASLLRAIVECACFVGLSGDDVVHPDAAVAHLEQLGAILKELPGQERLEVVTFIESMADAEEREAGRTERVQFLRSLAENLGLTDAG
jgi:hypothetical protein